MCAQQLIVEVRKERKKTGWQIIHYWGPASVVWPLYLPHYHYLVNMIPQAPELFVLMLLGFCFSGHPKDGGLFSLVIEMY